MTSAAVARGGTASHRPPSAPRTPGRRGAAASRTLSLLLPLALVAVAGSCASLPFFGHEARHVWGFTAPWDSSSAQSAADHASALDGVVSGWISLDTLTGMPQALFADRVGPALPAGTRRIALVTTFVGTDFRPATIRALAADSGRLTRAAGAIAGQLSAGGYSALVLDFEELSSRDLPALLAVTGTIRDSAHARGISPVVIAVPAGDTSGYPGRPLAGMADALLVMLYDEHWAGSPAGPIASPDWARRALGVRIGEVGAQRIIASLPLFGYLWHPGPPADIIGFLQAQQLAARIGRVLERDPASETLRLAAPGQWELWVSDAELLQTLAGDAESAGVHRLALWRLGLEDPAIWTTLVGR